MAISGYGLTVVGTATGAITADVQAVNIGGLTLDFSEIKEVGDTNRIPTNLPMTVRDAPIEITMTYDETLYNTLHAKLLSLATDTWTITGSDSSTHVSTAAYVSAVSGLNYDTDGHATYTVTLTPTTGWTFTEV